MNEPSFALRRELTARLRENRQGIAERVAKAFSRRPSDDHAHLDGEEIAAHLDFLAGAVEGGTVSAFADYARWTARVAQARNIPPAFVAESFRRIEEALGGTLAPEFRPVVSPFLAAGRAAALAGDEPAGEAEEEDPLALHRRIFLQAILAGRRDAAVNVVLEALDNGHDLRDLYVEIFQKALYEVGRLWEANRITVADEHLATAVTQYVVARAYERLPTAETHRGRAIITGVQGELHQVGANMVADLLEADGWDVRFLGTDMPAGDILTMTRDHQAELLGISATMLFNLPQVIALVERLRAELGTAAPRIILGGGAFRLLPELPAELKVDAVATELRQGVELARSLQQ
ncbi:cobalamin B12-binding domain-containing protein [Trichloromonas sp.]|uniref:cobalamin B12-binding domain-containing protein n=1 Tax=Trichloromonas sp. TaxID=3069249 RepID=UPI002A38FB44|nr:cobalamin-dependent protein [Trichloromonas sp.]